MPKNISKNDLQFKLRLTISITGLTYLIYTNFINLLTAQTGLLSNMYSFSLDVVVNLIVAGLSMVVMVNNWAKLTTRIKLIDILFVLIYTIYLIMLTLATFGISFGYFIPYSNPVFSQIIAFIIPAIFTITWISYSLWNGYLSVKSLNQQS